MINKWRLYNERREVGSLFCLCELCHYSHATDLHEIVNRVHYPVDFVDKVPDALLALLCNDCNTKYADRSWARKQLLVQNIERYGIAGFGDQVSRFSRLLKHYDAQINIYSAITDVINMPEEEENG